MIQKWPLMHASRLVTEKPLKEPQTKVLVTKEGDNAASADLVDIAAESQFTALRQTRQL